jgi:hypothetical protein
VVAGVRSQGIFLRIRENVLLNWQAKTEVQELEGEFLESHKAWRRLRKLDPVHDGFPGIRLVLLHSLSHALMRQIVLDCGYTAASVREPPRFETVSVTSACCARGWALRWGGSIDSDRLCPRFDG